MAKTLQRSRSWREPDAAVLSASLDRALTPFAGDGNTAADALETIRETLYATMWDDAGIVRDAAGLSRAHAVMGDLARSLEAYRLPAIARERAFNMAWHEWLNLANLVDVSRVIVRAAQARENSRGAHFRADFPEPGDLPGSFYTRVRGMPDGEVAVEPIPVAFTRVRPGESLV
jgi:fumarate reductase flavoprotein subunit